MDRWHGTLCPRRKFPRTVQRTRKLRICCLGRIKAHKCVRASELEGSNFNFSGCFASLISSRGIQIPPRENQIQNWIKQKSFRTSKSASTSVNSVLSPMKIFAANRFPLVNLVSEQTSARREMANSSDVSMNRRVTSLRAYKSESRAEL